MNQPRPLLTTPQGGRIALDPTLLALWQHADGKTFDEAIASFQTDSASPDAIRAALACLAEAGLLERDSSVMPRILRAGTGSLVSAIIVIFNSREWLAECLPSLFAQTYSPLEIIVVDNASSDEAAEWLQSAYPTVRLVSLEQVQPLARAINLGVQAAYGEYLLILNADVRLESDAIAQMVEVARDDPACAAVAPKLKFWWAPAFFNGVGNFAGAFSWGTDIGLGHLDLGQFDAWEQVPSTCFAATLISKSIWEIVGIADECFPMYYEDIEWSYRARALGYTVRVASQAVVYHAFGSRVPSGIESSLTYRKLRNVVYGRLRFASKILGTFRRRFLQNYILEDSANILRATLRWQPETLRAYFDGWRDFWNCWPALVRERQALQARRTRSDAELFASHNQIPAPLVWHGLPELTWDLVLHHYLPLFLQGQVRPTPEFDSPRRRPRLLIITNDVVDTKMAGPGMRYLEMGRALSPAIDVTLAIPAATSLNASAVRLVQYAETQPTALQSLVAECGVVLVTGALLEKFPFLKQTHVRLVVDLYDPIVLENLHYYLNESLSDQQILNRQAVDVTNRLAQHGDFFICGSERQRDLWMGVLMANGRVNPKTFAQDADLRTLIDVVGIGFPNREPNSRPMLRGVHPAFPMGSRIVLWGGGIWNWLDPLTLVRAWQQVLVRHPEARLVFLGTRHPNPLVPLHKIAAETQSLAERIGEKDRTIFFFEWLAFEEREALLAEADVGVSLHPLHIETRYSIRTRVVDYFWARLPVVVTDGDVTSEWVRQYELGKVVPPQDVNAVARALNEILGLPKGAWTPAFEPLREVFAWTRVIEPLRRYCLQGRYAEDRVERAAVVGATTRMQNWRNRWTRAQYIWRTQGLRLLLHRVWRYVQWKLAQPG